MKKALFIMFLGILFFSAGCSKDDMSTNDTQAEVTAETTEILAKNHAKCIDPERIQLNCSSADMSSPITFTWDNSKVSYVFNRVYKSYIQIESNNCPDANLQTVDIPIHFFSTSSYTLAKGRNETCFKYRIVILGYDKGQQACESILPWQVFDYSETEEAAQEQEAEPLKELLGA